MGLILGIQFLFWTIGGLYFSWSNMDEVHGDHQKAHVHPLSADIQLVNPQDIIQKIKEKDSITFVHDIHLIQILDKPVYQIIYSKGQDSSKKIQLADAQTGEIRPALYEKEAVEIANKAISDNVQVKQVEYLITTSGHHEYSEQPLHAFAVTFAYPSNTTVHVNSALGSVQKFRNNKWRIFDYFVRCTLWDYHTGDNPFNWLLRTFSIFGLFTVSMGLHSIFC